ncbi:PQQ-binding-like beta-propeller repeat protein [Micromonospora sp. DR5-3]|uniref:PQQ-binding-like beta-propeller repeat protein n=1 Tax=unclassified Micromonospora TaxID=2617518 RepID=UPI0011DB076F|nr:MULTISPECIES: PQQ-binding-like beta-propeller repeat protein [unclassified Micromonospora]MCW3820605.1 PQQ-binding-like beta-propeller repeat protein [Micromonospora sp. DR5-3]TYC19073.1 PQQ-like beta-propeller repeat protein [Micromonospora sp. MP36]
MTDRRTFIRYAATVTAVPALSAAPAALGVASAAVPTVTVDPLGVPLRDVLLIGGTVAPGPTGAPVLWSAVSGEPARLAAIDPATGRTVSTQALTGAPGSYAVAAAPDGTIYVGAYSTGDLYRRRPGPDSPVENLGRPLPSETYLWRLAVDEAGVVYGGTFPGARVFAFDPGTGETRDYGQVLPGAQYVRSIAVAGDKVYAGTQPDAHLFEIDKSTGERRELPLPAGIGGGAGLTVYDLNAYGGRLYARFGSATTGTLGVYDIQAGRWTDLIDGVAGLDVSAPGPGGLVYLTRAGRLTGYHPGTRRFTDTPLVFPGRVVNNRGIGWVTLADPRWPGRTLVGLLWRGDMFRYNPVTGRADVVSTDVPGEPIPLASLHAGASGTVYVGGYLNGGFARVDPDTGAPTFQRFAQVESLLETGGQVYLGAYPDSRLYRYDLGRSWSSPEYSPGLPGMPDNPVKLVDLKSADQVRARALTDAGDKVAYGTMPNTTLGGALVIVDKANGAATVHRPVVTDSSIVSLARAGGLVVGGTSIDGGYSVPRPTQTEARLFGWDVGSDSKAFEFTPVPGATAIPALAVDRSGLLWGLAGGQLFAVDVAARSVVRRVQLAPGVSGSRARLGYDADRNLLYALVAGQSLFRVDASTGAATLLLDRPAEFLAVHPDGRLFLGDGPQLYRVTVSG